MKHNMARDTTMASSTATARVRARSASTLSPRSRVRVSARSRASAGSRTRVQARGSVRVGPPLHTPQRMPTAQGFETWLGLGTYGQNHD